MEKILETASKIPPLEKYISYGTAGFRSLASNLPMVAFKVGLILLKRASETDKYIGVEITASHNPVQDNGLKLVDYNGGIFPREWESEAESFVNGRLEDYTFPSNQHGTVLIGYDTRPSSQDLANYVKAGVESGGGLCIILGALTTPQLYYLVKKSNMQNSVQEVSVYIEDLKAKMNSLNELIEESGNYEKEIVIDTSGGVGNYPLGLLEIPGLEATLINTDLSRLNHMCGSDFVHTQQTLPRDGVSGKKSASIDGDADRLVYYKNSEEFMLLGGDRLMVLFCQALRVLQTKDGIDCPLTVITNYYTNNGCLQYLHDIGIDVRIVPVGVKYLYVESKQHPLSVYFESNGHGGVMVSEEFIEFLRGKSAEYTLRYLTLSEGTVWDAVCDLIVTEFSLRLLGWSLEDWFSLYKDWCCRLVAVSSPLKDLIKTSKDESEVLEPAHLVRWISEVKQEFSPVKVIVRASGTEPVVKIYVEAPTQITCDLISERLKENIQHAE